MKEINADREAHGKKPFSDDDTKPPETEEKQNPQLTPKAESFRKENIGDVFAYNALTKCDKHGYILDVTINAGNMQDSTAFDELYDRLILKFPEIHHLGDGLRFQDPVDLQTGIG